ncbi:Protein of unknown function [Pyronema omphalodes CBS 100304]|uniref:Uncharacterized protein n=1 Tax=Pyronema omphalodes (strain CBS 100304) TaxID=1076935 RepID=U4LNC6_PYROM|nr:Protein of unknown function [Pyronema omphalodes CBS 100304]
MNPTTTTSRVDEGLQIPGAIVHDPFENYHWWNGDVTSPTDPNPPECCIACCSKPLCCRPRDKYEIAFMVLRMVEFAIGLFFTIPFFRMADIVYIIEFLELSPIFYMVLFPVVTGLLMTILGCVTHPSHKFPLWQMILEIVLQSTIECIAIVVLILMVLSGTDAWGMLLLLVPLMVICALLIALDSYCIAKRHTIRNEDMKVQKTSLSIEIPQVNHHETGQNNGHGFWHTIFPWY